MTGHIPLEKPLLEMILDFLLRNTMNEADRHSGVRRAIRLTGLQGERGGTSA
jgi:hypothetical protein